MELKIIYFFLVVAVVLAVVRCENLPVKNVTALEKGNNAEADRWQAFKAAEKEITDYINSILRSFLPKMLESSGRSNLSPMCTGSLMKIFGNVRKLKGWTLKMLDSIGKPNSGILKGTSYSMGHYDECLSISVTNRGKETTVPEEEMFRGQYCRIRIRFPDAVIETAHYFHKGKINASDLGKLKDIIETIPFMPFSREYMSHFLGFCTPSSCSMEDVQQLVQVIPFPGTATLDGCEVKSRRIIEMHELITLTLFSLFITIIFLASFVDWLRHLEVNRKSPIFHNNRCISLIITFSFFHNTKRLFDKKGAKKKQNDTMGHCVRGIIVLSTAWIICGNTYLLPSDTFYTVTNSLENLHNYISERYFAFVVAFPLAIDAIFTCYGFLLTFPIWYQASKTSIVNVGFVNLIITRYIRLCLPLIFTLGVIVILPLVGSGPFWMEIFGQTVAKCRSHAWSLVGMYSNFLDLQDQCFPHLWFAACAFQITIIAAVLCLIVARNAKVGGIILILAIVGCGTTTAVLSYLNELPPSYVAYFVIRDWNLFWKISYSLPISHFGPFAVGMLTGIIVPKKSHHNISTVKAIIGWIVSISGMCGIIVALFELKDVSFAENYWVAIYAGFHRIAFSLCLAWIITACCLGNGGFVNSFLSWKAMEPLFKLSYFAYLIHFIIIYFVVATARGQFYYSHMELILKSSAYIFVTYVFAFFFYMIIEMPLRSFQSQLFIPRVQEIIATPRPSINLELNSHFEPKELQDFFKLDPVKEIQNGVP